ncbi:MFS transporter [Rodentibacter caecimuris]
MPGSPASPDHSFRRRLAYFFIGLLFSINAGLQNGLMLAMLPQAQGQFSLTLEQSGWIQVSYYMTYACMSILFFKIRQHFGLNRFIRTVLLLLLSSNLLQLIFNNYTIELLARGILGIASSGAMTLSIFYIMQSLSGKAKLTGVVLGIGIVQLGPPLARILAPFLFNDGNMSNIFLFQFALTILSIGLIIKLPLPPSIKTNVLSKLDMISFTLFATGIALLCGFLVQGRIVWWTAKWLGIMLAVSIILIGSALCIEANRRQPMLDWHWISTKQIIAFGLMGAAVRLLTSEQSVGAAGLMTALGMNNEQMVTFYVVVLLSSLFGLIASILTLNMQDIRRPVAIALLGIAIGSFLDTQVGLQTRPHQLYFSQAIIAFSTLYFFGPTALEGMVRALSKSTNHMMSYSAVFGLSQSLGGLAGAAIFSAFLTYRTKAHLANISHHLTLTDPNVSAQLQQLAQQFSPFNSDGIIQQIQANSILTTQATTEATVLAYNDLFMLIGTIATITFLYCLAAWYWRKQQGIIILQNELAVLMSRSAK